MSALGDDNAERERPDNGFEPELLPPAGPELPRHPARATWVLVAANIAVFALETLWGGSQHAPTLFRMGANAGRAVLLEEPWRVLSSAFLHIGFVHLLLNMWALTVFGLGLEGLMGARRLMVLYGLSALGGGLASSLAHGDTLSAGASGAVWGLMLAEIVLLFRPQVLLEDLALEVNKWSVLQPLVLNLIFSLQPGIDLVAHLGGGLAGAAVMGSGLLARRPDSRAWNISAAAVVTAIAASLGLAFANGRPWEVRAPVLEMRSLPGSSITLSVPRGLPARTEGKAAVFGHLRRDPLAVVCEVQPADEPVAPRDQRAVLQARVPKARAETLARGLRRESGPGVIDLPQRPALHQALRYENGARAEVWVMLEGSTFLTLTIVQRPDLPTAWRALPQRIAEGVRFGGR